MTTRNPTKAERAAHALRVSNDRMFSRLLERCRDCVAWPGINPRTGKPFVSCREHRRLDRERKKKK